MRDAAGAPVVLRNAPFTRAGVPMPTRYWLCDPTLTRRVARLEAAGGVRAAEAAVDPERPDPGPRRLRRRAQRRDPPRAGRDPDPTAVSAAPAPA